MVRLNLPNGTIEFEDPALTAELLKHQQQVEADAKANAAELNRFYTPKELAAHLRMSERSTYELIRKGLIGYCCIGGSKGYRVSGEDILRFRRGLPPLNP